MLLIDHPLSNAMTNHIPNRVLTLF